MNRIVDDGALNVARARNAPRFDYPFGNFPTPDNFSRLINRAMVIRPPYFARATATRTAWKNWVRSSNVLDDAGQWDTERVTPERQTEGAPNKADSWKLREDGANDSHFVQQTGVAIVAGAVVRYIVAKAGERSRINLTMVGDVSVAMGFDLSAGETYPNGMGMSDPEQAVIFPIAEAPGWFFCGMKQTFVTGLIIQTLLDDGSGINYPGDNTSGLFVAFDHVVNADTFGPIFETGGEPRTIQAPNLDPGDEVRAYDPFSFLLEETNPATDQVGRYGWERMFGRIPPNNSLPISLAISKPAVPGTGDLPRLVGDYFVKQTFLPNIWDAYFRIATTGDSGIPSFFPTSGTYTVTFDGDTTAPIAFDAVAAVVQTALNLLASVIARGGVTVTGAPTDPDGFEIVFADYATGTIDDSGLVCGGSGVALVTTVTPLNGGYRQDVAILPRQDNGFPVGTSSFGPAGANPMTVLIQDTSRFSIALGDSITLLQAATSGDFTLTWFGDTTAPIPWNASAGDIQTALNLLAGVTTRGGATVTFVGLVNSVPTFAISLPLPAIVSGDFTVELFGDTTGPIPWNASISDIETEINLLAGVIARGGATVSAVAADPISTTAIKFSVVFGNPLVTGNVAGLSPGAVFSATTGDAGINQTQSFEISSSGQRILGMPGHSISTGQECFIPVAEEQGFIIAGNRVTRIDENTVSFTVSASDPDAAHTPINEFDPLTKRGYKPGAATIAAQRLSSYYLPGVTIGINSQADIPIPESQSDTDTFLQMAFSGAGLINWQVGELVQWKGPIVSLSRTVIAGKDV